MKYYLMAVVLFVSISSHAAKYFVSLPITHAYDNYGHYHADRLSSMLKAQKILFEECSNEKGNILREDYYPVNNVQAKIRSQIIPQFPFGISPGYGMDIYVNFNEKNKHCTNFIDNLHTGYGEHVRLSEGYTPVDWSAEYQRQKLNDTCSSAKDKCAVDPHSNNCKWNVGSENILRNKQGEVKGAIIQMPTSILAQVCFFDKVGTAWSVRPLYLDAIEYAINE